MRKIKIFLTTLAIAGVLFATSSCVDDSESASVTELRGLRAEQLKAKAALDNAQATLISAQVEYERIKTEAEAKLNVALAEYQDVQTAIAKENLDARKAEVLLEILQAETEYQKLLVTAEKELLKAKRELVGYKTTEIGALLTEYANLLDEINSSRRTIAESTVNLAKKQLDLDTYAVDSARFVENFINSMKNAITNDSLTIVRNTKRIAEWEAFDVDDDIAALIAKKEAELAKVEESIPTLLKESRLAQANRDDAQSVYNSLNKLYNDYVSYSNGTVKVPEFTYVDYSNEPKWAEDGVTYTHKGTDNNTFVYSGYSANRKAPIYSSRLSYNVYGWYVLSSYNNSFDNPDGYTSVEDYEHVWRTLLVDTANLKREYNSLLAQYNSLTSKVKAVGDAEYTARVAEETAEKEYLEAKDIFDISAKGRTDSADYLPFIQAYLGTNIRGVVVDPKGGAFGVWKDAETKYNALQDSIRSVSGEIITTGTDLATRIVTLRTYSEVIKVLSQGSRADIFTKKNAALDDLTHKQGLVSKAATAYSNALTTASSLRTDIGNWSGLWGFLTDGNGNRISYGSQTAEFIQIQINNLQSEINSAQANIDGSKLKLANVALYATNDATDAVALAVEYIKSDIEKLKALIAAEKQEIDVCNEALKLVQAGIDLLLAEPAGE
jgi:hypothetical protein